MTILATPFHAFVAVYRLVVSLWNACIVLFQVMQSVMQEARQEAAEVMALLDDGAAMMGAITSTSFLLDASGPTSPGQMLIIARASSFVLLLRLSKHRVLHLEVDERFIATRLEVIQTELMLHIQHVPRLLQVPIGTHDTRLVRYRHMKLPYLWKEEQAGLQGGDEDVEKLIIPALAASPVKAGSEGRSRRKKCVQLLTESALRRRLHMDRLGHVGSDGAPKRGTGVMKAHGENAGKRRALGNATNMGMDADGTSDETRGSEAAVADTPKQVRMERNIHTALSENLSIPNMAQTTSLHKAVNVSHPRRSDSYCSSRRKRGQFDLYAQGVTSEFSLLSQMGQGRD